MKVLPVVAIAAALVVLLVVIAGAISAKASSATSYNINGMIAIHGNTIQEKVWYGLRMLGYSEISTAAAMGNIHYESGSFNPNSIEGNIPANEEVGGIGICQWTNNWDNGQKGATGRCTDLKAYAASKGLTWRDENVQVEFLLAELNGGGAGGYAKNQLQDTTYTGTTYKYSDWKNATDTTTLDEENLKWLTEVFCFTFERPDTNAGRNSIDARYGHALNYYNQFHGTELPSLSFVEPVFTGDSFTDSTGRTYKIYKQNGPEYKNAPYPARGQGATIGTRGCGPTACTIVGSGYGCTDTPSSLVASGDNYSWAHQVDGYFRSRGFTLEIIDSSQIINKLSAGYDIVLLFKEGGGYGYDVRCWPLGYFIRYSKW